MSKQLVRWFSALLLVFLVVQSSVTSAKRAAEPDGNDFGAYMIASQAVWSAQNPYRIPYPAAPYIYPPFVAALMYPLTFLPQGIASGLWAFLSGITLLACLHFLQEKKAGIWKLALFMLINLSVLQQNLVHGQINIAILALLFLAEWMARRNRFFVPGIIASVAIAPKITPAVVLLHSLLERRIRFLLTVAGALPVLLIAIPWALGLPLKQLYSDMAFHLRLRANPELIGEKAQFSMQDVALFFGGSQIMVFVTVGILLLLLTAFLFWTHISELRACRRRVSQSEEHKDIIPPPTSWLLFSLYLAAIVLISPLSERHHLVFILPASWLLFLSLTQDKRNLKQKWGVLYIAHLILLSLGGKLFGGPVYLVAVLTLLLAVSLKMQADRNHVSEAQPSGI